MDTEKITNLTEAVRTTNSWFGLGGPVVFKPGYRTARGQYMVETGAQAKVAEILAGYGWRMDRVPCGHDYNCNGDLFRISPATRA